MELTRPGTDVRLPRPHHYPAMTGEERLKALRAIRGMWKGQGQAIMQRIEAGREDRTLPPHKAKPGVCPRYQCHYLLHR